MRKKTLFGFPRQIANIVGNEACERFSYYGMRSILIVFMTHHLLMPEPEAKATYHLFVMAVYFMPLIGGYIADRFWGKYKAILYLSLFYCLGHGVLAAFESREGMYWGLGLIALGAGGIKPCVSSFVGDQFDRSNQHLISKVYDLFYFSINFGSVGATILIPWLLPTYGSKIAFGIPGVLMAVATLIFWLGRKNYVIVEPTGKAGETKFLAIVWHGLKNLPRWKKGSWLDAAQSKFGAERVDGVKAALGCAVIFACTAVFWALWDQTASTWIIQAEKMDLIVMGVPLLASQIQTINPILIMALIPLLSWVVYPGIEKLGYKMTPLRKIAGGMLLTGLSFVLVGWIQLYLDAGVKLNISWQFFPFLILTISEVLVSITGLEFAYTQAPKSMKGVIMSMYCMSIALGNLLAAVVSALNPFDGPAPEFFFYAGLVFAVALVFTVIARFYKVRNFVAST